MNLLTAEVCRVGKEQLCSHSDANHGGRTKDHRTLGCVKSWLRDNMLGKMIEVEGKSVYKPPAGQDLLALIGIREVDGKTVSQVIYPDLVANQATSHPMLLSAFMSL